MTVAVVWFRRDATLEREPEAAGLACESFGAALLYEPWQVRTAQGGPYKAFTPYWRACLHRWLPELARLPDTWIHRPWQAPADVLVAAGVVLGGTHPRPVIDLATRRRAARAAHAAIR